MGKGWKKYYDYEKKDNSKWVGKDGSHCDDIIFTNGQVEVGFDEWLEIRYK